MNHSKLPGFGTTIFTVMSQLANDCGAINLSQGFPDFPAPDDLLTRVNQHMLSGHNQYAPMAGVPELREQIALKTKRMYAHEPDADTEVTVTSGATEALFTAITTFVHDDDEVIVFDPAYDSYDPAIRLAGGRAIHIPMAAPDFCIDWTRVADAINDRTKMIVLNSPHNPTGSVLDDKDMTELASLVDNTNIILLSDEVYEHIIFDGRSHASLLCYPELARRSLVVSSFGKTFHMTGWKIGYCIAPAPLMAEFRKVHQFVQFCVVTPMQLGLADFLQAGAAPYLELPEFYQCKRDEFCAQLQDSRFEYAPSAGTYFQIVDYSAITDEPDVEYARRLTREAGVACIPVSVFYETAPDQHLLRFCFAKNTDTLKQATEILCRI